MRRRRHIAPWTNDLNGMGDELPVPHFSREFVGRRPTHTPTAGPPRLRLTGGGRRRRRPSGQQTDAHAVSPTTTISACASTADRGRQSNHHDFSVCLDRLYRPSAQPPRLRPVLRLSRAPVPSTTTTSASTTAAHHGRPCTHHGFGLCSYCHRSRLLNHHDFSLRLDCS